MAVGAIVARILTQYSDKGSKQATKDINKLGKNFDAFAKKAGKAFAVAGAAVAAFAVKVGKDAVQAAIADQKSQVLLANSLRNTTGATNAAIASVEAYVSQLQLQVGVADDELRPSLSRLAAVTGDVASAQELLGTALDVSAFSGADLNSTTLAITRALQGNFRSLQKLVPSIDATVVKSKDLAAIFREVEKATQGAAGARAGTLEYRLKILGIRFNEILETLGYALIPILEEFAQVLTADVLPKIARWVELNKKGLAEGLKNAASAAIELLKAAVAVGAWFVENFNTVKNFAILLASIWATGKVIAFATAIGKVTLAFQAMQTAAVGAGAASAGATAGTAGTSAFLAGAKSLGIIGLVTTAITGLTLGLSKISPGEKARARARALETSLAGYKGSPGASDLPTLANTKSAVGASDGLTAYEKMLNTIIKAQGKLNQSKIKELSTEQKIINAMLKKYGLTAMTSEIEAKATAAAIGANLNRQAFIAATAPTVQLANQGDGSAPAIMGSNTPSVYVNINTPFGTKDDFYVAVQNYLKTEGRRGGGGFSGGRFGNAAE